MSIHLWPQGMYPWIVLNITWKCLFKVLSTDRLLNGSSNDKEVQYPTCQGVSKGGICWFLYKQTDMEISSMSFNLLNSGSKEGKLKEMIFFQTPSKGNQSWQKFTYLWIYWEGENNKLNFYSRCLATNYE